MKIAFLSGRPKNGTILPKNEKYVWNEICRVMTNDLQNPLFKSATFLPDSHLQQIRFVCLAFCGEKQYQGGVLCAKQGLGPAVFTEASDGSYSTYRRSQTHYSVKQRTLVKNDRGCRYRLCFG